MSKSVVIIETPEHCTDCPMSNGNEECILQDEDANFQAESWGDLKNNCPLRDIPQRKSEEFGQTIINAAKAEGWNACLDAIEGRGAHE